MLRSMFAVVVAIAALLAAPARALPTNDEIHVGLEEACPVELEAWLTERVATGAFPTREAARAYLNWNVVWSEYSRELVTGVIAASRGSMAREPGNPVYALDHCMYSRFLALLDGEPFPPAGQSAPAAAPVIPVPSTPQVRAAAHNAAAEASDCIQPIGRRNFEKYGVRSNMEAVLRNNCAFPVDIVWCIVGADCSPGYTNLGAIAAGPGTDRPISYVATNREEDEIKWAACRNGFIDGQAELSRRFEHACK